MAVIVGVDPGLTGAIAMLEGEIGRVGCRLVTVRGMRAMRRSMQTPVEAPLVVAYMREWARPGNGVRVVCEQALAIPNMGAMSRVSLGHAVGMIEGVAASFGWMFEVVHPTKWKKIIPGNALTEGRTKEAAAELAALMFPEVMHVEGWEGKDRSGIADAICIALWGARELAGVRFRVLGGDDDVADKVPASEKRSHKAKRK